MVTRQQDGEMLLYFRTGLQSQWVNWSETKSHGRRLGKLAEHMVELDLEGSTHNSWRPAGAKFKSDILNMECGISRCQWRSHHHGAHGKRLKGQ